MRRVGTALPQNLPEAQSNSGVRGIDHRNAVDVDLADSSRLFSKALMAFPQKDTPSRHFPLPERAQQFQRPQYFQKGSTCSLDPLLAKSNPGISTPRNRPRSRATTVASIRTNAYAASIVSARKSTVRQHSGFSSDSIATGPERLENLAKTLIARGSRLLRRHNSTPDSASIRTVEWLGQSEGKMGKHKSQSCLNPGYGHERKNSTAGKRRMCSEWRRGG